MMLEGETETITATDFRKSPGEVLDQASLGKVFTITKKGRPIAKIVQFKCLHENTEQRTIHGLTGEYVTHCLDCNQNID